MNGHPHVAHLEALHWKQHGGQMPALGHECPLPGAQEKKRSPLAATARFEQARSFNWRRYKRARAVWGNRITLAGVVVSAMALLVLFWRLAEGEAISQTRWLLGAGAGFFVIGMLRLALFVVFAAPAFIAFGPAYVRLSGLGVLRAEDILHWTLRAGRRCRRKEAVHLEITCLWHGVETSWSMELEKGAEAERLQDWLRATCPQAAAYKLPRATRLEELEAGLMTVVGGVPGLGAGEG